MTKGGIFGWYRALGIIRKPFNNKYFFSILLNTSNVDFKMIITDFVKHLNLHYINISNRINESISNPNGNFNPDNIRFPKTQELLNDRCANTYGNIYHLCKNFNIDLNMEKYGISQTTMNIFIANVFGYIPTVLVMFILSALFVIYYIVQMALSCSVWKPKETTKPHIAAAVFFYVGIALIVISVIFYFCGYKSFHDFYYTLVNLDTLILAISKSLASGMKQIADIGIPEATSPILTATLNVCNKTINDLNDTVYTVISSTLNIQNGLFSRQHDGVFNIYQNNVEPTAKDFYALADTFPNLTDLPVYFISETFDKYKEYINMLVDNENKLSKASRIIQSFFNYYIDLLHPYQRYIINIAERKIHGTNKTINQYINEIDAKTITNFGSFAKIANAFRNNIKIYYIACSCYFIFGVFVAISIFWYGVAYMMHNCYSRYVASTVSIFPLIATIIMFAFSFIFTGIGFADITLSDQFEPSLDYMLNLMINETIENRTIIFPSVNVTLKSDDVFHGILNISNITFPIPYNLFTHFIHYSKNDGVADAFELAKVVPTDKYGQEIGSFLENQSINFTLPQSIQDKINQLDDILKDSNLFPTTLSGFFHWDVPYENATNILRKLILEKNKDAYQYLNPYLEEIDNYSQIMTRKYAIVSNDIYNFLPNISNFLSTHMRNSTSTSMKILGDTFNSSVNQVYPILNTVKIEPIVGPYAIIRNALFYDISCTSAYISASGTLMIFGYLFIDVLLWERRRGMNSKPKMKNGFELHEVAQL